MKKILSKYSFGVGDRFTHQAKPQLKAMIKAKRSEGKAVSKDQVGFCDGVNPSMKEMCKGYSKYLKECPSFVHNICHQDVGGAEQLLSPCPEHLTCYYCLRINPIYCLA